MNFIMIDFYTRTVPEDRVKFFKNEFSKNDEYKSADRILERTFVTRYMEHKVTLEIQYL